MNKKFFISYLIKNQIRQLKKKSPFTNQRNKQINGLQQEKQKQFKKLLSEISNRANKIENFLNLLLLIFFCNKIQSQIQEKVKKNNRISTYQANCAKTD